MNLRTYLLLLLTLLLSTFGHAQEVRTGTIEGVVVDARTGEPLLGVNILVVGTSRGTATDVEGRFRIGGIPAGIVQLRFTYLGYRPLVLADIMVMSGRTQYLEVALQPEPVALDSVRVTAGYFVEEMTPQPSIVTLSREEIRRQPGGFEDVVRTVASLPGVTINNAGGRNDLLVRGGGPSENLYVINEIEVPNINHFGTQGTTGGTLSFINLDLVEEVSFASGGFGVEYGDRMASVLRIKLGNGRRDRPGGKVLVSATQFGAQAEGPLADRGSFILSARRSYLDLIFKAAGLPFVPVFTDMNLLVNLEPSPRDRLSILGLGAVDWIDRRLEDEKDRVFNAALMDNRQHQWIGGLAYRRALRKGSLNLTLNLNRVDFRFHQADENLQTYFRSRAQEKEWGLKTRLIWALKPTLYLRSGVSLKRPSIRQTAVFADTVVDRNGRRVSRTALGLPGVLEEDLAAWKSAVFQELEWAPAPGLEVRGGLRVQYTGALAQPWSIDPRVQLRYVPAPGWALKVSSGLYHQTPSLVWLVNPANRRLRPMQNWMSVLGLEHRLREDTRMVVEVYTKRYRQLPTGVLPGVTDYLVITYAGAGFGGREDDFQSFGFIDLVSRGHGRAYGAEFYVQKKLSDLPFFGQASLSYGKSTFVPGNGRTYPGPFDQRWILNLSGGYLVRNRWQFSGRFRYFTGVPYTPVYRPTENPRRPGYVQNLPEEYLSARLPAGHQLDLRVDRFFYFRTWTLILYLDVQNVYNYRIPIKPRYDFSEDRIVDSNTIGLLPSIGISLNL